jgi:hypothetical protein
MTDLSIEANLPSGVAATGKHAAVADTIFSAEASGIVWRAPRLPTIGAERLVLAFEVAITPREAAAVWDLLTDIRATAKADGRDLAAVAPAVTTLLH